MTTGHDRRIVKSHVAGLDSLRPNETRILAGVCQGCNAIVFGDTCKTCGRVAALTFYLRIEKVNHRAE